MGKLKHILNANSIGPCVFPSFYIMVYTLMCVCVDCDTGKLKSDLDIVAGNMSYNLCG